VSKFLKIIRGVGKIGSSLLKQTDEVLEKTPEAKSELKHVIVDDQQPYNAYGSDTESGIPGFGPEKKPKELETEAGQRLYDTLYNKKSIGPNKFTMVYEGPEGAIAELMNPKGSITLGNSISQTEQLVGAVKKRKGDGYGIVGNRNDSLENIDFSSGNISLPLQDVAKAWRLKQTKRLKENPDGPFSKTDARVVATPRIDEDLASVGAKWFDMLGMDGKLLITTPADMLDRKVIEKFNLEGALYGPVKSITQKHGGVTDALVSRKSLDRLAKEMRSEPGVSQFPNMDGNFYTRSGHEVTEESYLTLTKSQQKKVLEERVGQGPNTRGLINFDPHVRMSQNFEILAHELGHRFEMQEFGKLLKTNPKLHAQIRKEYRTWKDSVGDMSEDEWIKGMKAHTRPKLSRNSKEFGSAENLKSYNKGYFFSFDEWFADSVNKWAMTTVKPQSVMEKYFGKLGKKLKEYYDKVANDIVGDPLKMKPSPGMQKFLDDRVEFVANQRKALDQQAVKEPTVKEPTVKEPTVKEPTVKEPSKAQSSFASLIKSKTKIEPYGIPAGTFKTSAGGSSLRNLFKKPGAMKNRTWKEQE
tara:strand:+ start:398 stop:2149 length:1752 start_codon:yes stop_codon:yes gene_type:complete